MKKITGLSHLFKWENLHNWWLTKYFFAPLYIQNKFCNNEYNTCGCNYEVKCNEQEFSSQHNFLF